LGAILASRSLGAILALIIGAVVYLWTLGWRRIVAGGLIAVSLLFFIPPVQNFIASKNTSSSNRLTLWSYSKDFLTTSPKNFVFGAGIRQFFRKVQKEHYNQEELERLIYPHNILLNFWTEIGLFGMLGFVGVLIALFRLALRISQKDLLFGAGALSALTIFTAHGLIDVPYFKNDLAFIFWILATSIWLVSSNKKST
jgi:O-antigen ligase